MTTDLATIIAINRQRIGLDAVTAADDARFSSVTGGDRRLCVYGRMAPGGVDAHLLEPLGGTWQTATVRGYLENPNACTVSGECPGLAWVPTGDVIDCHLLHSEALIDSWARFDAHEGAGLVRLLIAAATPAGPAVANVYVSQSASRTQLMMLDGMNVHDEADFRL